MSTDATISCMDGDTSPGNTGYPTIGGYDLTPGNLVGYCKWGTSYEDSWMHHLLFLIPLILLRRDSPRR